MQRLRTRAAALRITAVAQSAVGVLM